MSEISPLDEFSRLIRRWWVIVILAIAGGAVGWLYHQQRAPIYEAKAVLDLSLDFAQTGNLAQFNADYAINTAGALMVSDPVISRLAAEVKASQLPVDPSQLRKMIRLERRMNLWELKVFSPDPAAAAAVANLWATEAIAELTEAHAHANRASLLRKYLQDWQNCYQAFAGLSLPPLCTSPSVPDWDKISSLEAELDQEQQASRGIIAALLFARVQDAELPGEPVAYGANWLILAGTLIGFTGGIILTAIRFSGR